VNMVSSTEMFRSICFKGSRRPGRPPIEASSRCCHDQPTVGNENLAGARCWRIRQHDPSDHGSTIDRFSNQPPEP